MLISKNSLNSVRTNVNKNNFNFKKITNVPIGNVVEKYVTGTLTSLKEKVPPEFISQNSQRG